MHACGAWCQSQGHGDCWLVVSRGIRMRNAPSFSRNTLVDLEMRSNLDAASTQINVIGISKIPRMLRATVIGNGPRRHDVRFWEEKMAYRPTATGSGAALE